MPLNYVNFFSLKYLLISKTTRLRLNCPKIDFCEVHLGISGGSHFQNMLKCLSFQYFIISNKK